MIKRLMLPGMGENSYVYYNEETKKGFLVDPGLVHSKISRFLEEEQIDLEAILLTHGHGDHIMGVEHYKERFGCPVYAHEFEKEILENHHHNHSKDLGGTVVELKEINYIKDGDILELAGTKVLCIHTPGHTRGGVCYLTNEGLFSGDTLFKLGIGRYDLFGGNFKALENSVVEVLYRLPEETKVYPGHGVPTSIGYEKQNNPHFRK